MKVFISYKSEDADLALKVHDSIKTAGIDTYLDRRDPEIRLTSTSITSYIVSKLGECTHILPLVTPITVASWWVPFEIGVATEKGLAVTTFAEKKVTLPEYLLDWPVIRSVEDLVWFKALAGVDANIQRFSESYMTKSASVRASDARQFEGTLKTLLQRNSKHGSM